jgi:hypothetical protein
MHERRRVCRIKHEVFDKRLLIGVAAETHVFFTLS